MAPTSVSVLGLGWMGTAIANTLLREGHQLTVWNRSPEKCAPFAGRALVAESVEQAVRASSLVFVCVRNYDVSDEMLHPPAVTAALSGKTLVQFSSGTAQRARASGQWAKDHNIAYLDCTMHGGPHQIGTGLGTFHYTGDLAVFEATLDVLSPLIGDSAYLGEDLGYAAALDFARLGTYTGLMTVLGSVFALLEAQGVREEDYLATVPFIDPSLFEAIRDARSADVYPSGTASLTTWKAWSDQWVQAGAESDLDLKVPELVRDVLALAVERGYGSKDIYALFEAFRAPSTKN